jgi:hypothetical protein
MGTKKDIIEEINFVSDRISTQVRMVAISLIIITWGLLVGTSQTVLQFGAGFKKQLLLVGIGALFSMVFDFLQYLFGYLNNKALLDKMEQENLMDAKYDKTDFRYKLRCFFFSAKQIVLGASILFFLYIVIPFLVS